MKQAVRWGGSLILVAILAWRLDWGQVGACFARLDPTWWMLAALLYAGSQLLSTLRWRLIARAVGFRGSYANFLGIYHIGVFFNLMLPTSVGGDVVRAWYLAGMRHAGEGRRALAAMSVLGDRLNGLMMLIVLAAVALLVSPVPLPTWVQASVGLAAGGFLVGLAGLSLLGHVVVTAMKLVCRRPWTLLAASLLSLAVQVLNVIVVWCIGLGLGLDVPLVCYGVVVPLATLLTLLPISLNGMGLREASFVFLLAPLGVGSAQAVALGFLQFLATLPSCFVGLGFYLFGRYPRYRPEPRGESLHDRTLSSDPDQGRARQSSAAA